MNVEKTIYLCRHGETNSNVHPTVQGWVEPLNERGVAQAIALAKRLARVSLKGAPIEAVYASTMTRAFRTAGIIGAALELEVRANDCLVECLHPTHLRGLPVDDPAFIAYMKERSKVFDKNIQLSDEETFEMAHARASEAVRLLRSGTEKCAVVVTHGMFLTYLINVMRYGDGFTPEMYLQSNEMFKNTGMVKVEYGTYGNYLRAGQKGWRVWTGDASHLDDMM